jgi:ribosomal protein S27AE
MPKTFVLIHQEICERCGAYKYHCHHCQRWVCSQCPPVPINNAWGFGCPYCGTYWSIYYDPPDGMSREEWEKEFQKRAPKDYEIYARNLPRREKIVQHCIATFGEFKKVTRSSTGESFKVPVRDILEKGIKERELDKYPRWKE